MRPLKSKTFIKPTSEILDADPVLVEDITTFFWEELKKTLINCTSHNVKVHNFGTFVARPRKVQNLINKYDTNLKYIQPVTFQKCQNIQEIKKRRSKLEIIQELIQRDVIKKEQIKLKRDGNA